MICPQLSSEIELSIKAEIERTEIQIRAKKHGRSVADAVFKM